MDLLESSEKSDIQEENSKSNDHEFHETPNNSNFIENDEKCDSGSNNKLVNNSFILDDKFAIVNGCIDFSSNVANKK